MSKLASLDIMIVTWYTIFYIIFISVESHFGVFWGPFWCMFFNFWEPCNISHEFCTDIFGITLMVTTLKISFHVMFSYAGGHFGIFLDLFWCVIFFENCSIFFHFFFQSFLQIFRNFIDSQQSHYEETVYFLPLSPQTVLVLVILQWS